ncbi:MAG: FG-GAP repeat protein, partial [Candidatus Thermoplasmatota archaeon]|nr:FG-GAP repeat protein [Candidatus Thermoplasmatota archaeon]
MAELKANYGKGAFLAIFLVGLFTVSSLLVLVSTGATGEESEVELTDQPTGPTRLSGTLSLKNQGATQKFKHTTNYAYSGSSVISGDVNGDGADDVIIGARGANSYTGEILVYFGMISTAPLMTDAQADVKISAPSGVNYFGETIGVGDVDGDGIDDIISGSMYGSSYRGEAYIYFGNKAWRKGTTVSSSDVIFKGQSGTSTSVYFGMDVWVEDLDGDLVDDVIVVEPYYQQGRVLERWKGYSYNVYNYTGLCFIFFGRSRTEWGAKGVTYDLNSGLPANTVRIKGWAPLYSGTNYRYAYIGYYGGQALHAGDFNGDKINDLVIGGYLTYTGGSYSYAGATTVIFGMNRTNWMRWSGQYDLLARQGEYMFFTNHMSSAYTGQNPRLGDINGDGFDDLITTSYRGTGSYEGKYWVIFGTNDATRLNTLMKTQQNTWPYGGYYNLLDSVADLTIVGSETYAYGSSAWCDDFDGDGYDDLLIGAGGAYVGSYYYAGKVYLFYGRPTAQWKAKFTWSFSDSDWVAEGEQSYSYLGYYYYQTLGSGDFNNDKIADILMGAPMDGGSYFGACYMQLTVPPKLELGKFDIVDADGFDGKTVLPETGGAPMSEKATNLTGDGVYTFNGNLTDSWTVNEVQELRVIMSLRGIQMGVQYSFGYGLENKTFFTINNPSKGMSLVKEQSNFQYLGFQSAEFNLSVKFHLTFLNQEPFDVIYQAVRKSGIEEIRLNERLHLEKDLVLEGTDFYVTRDGAEVHRGEYLAVGGPLKVTGMRIIHPGTIVSPADDKFFVRVFDSYSRIFEDKSSSGRQIYVEIPMSVDSGIYKFSMDVILSEYAAQYMTVTAVVPAFYLQLDFNGPDRPRNVRFHSDGLVDPEGRWDNDLSVWVTWDPSFDT